MSLPTRRQAFAFLRPLKGKSTTFIVANRNANLSASRFILTCLATLRIDAGLFDTSCCYGVNIRKLTDGLPSDFKQRSTISYITEGLTYEESLTRMLLLESPAILIDDLNAILHLLSSHNRKSGIHRLSTFYHTLSYAARLNSLLVMGMVYKTGPGSAARSSQRSLSRISEVQVVTEARVGGDVTFRSDDVPEWPKDGFRATPYFEPKT